MNTVNDTRRNWVRMPDERTLARAVRKIEWHVLPLLIVMFTVNYIDRINVSYVRPQLQADLGIGVAAYGFGAGMFFLTYALLEVPSNVMLQRLGARSWLARMMATWGVVSVLMAFVRNDVEFAVVRALLGAAEAGFAPGVFYYIKKCLPEEDYGKAVALFMSGTAISSIVSNPLSAALLNIQGFQLHGWQWLFLIEGVGTLLLSGLAWFTLISSPEEATFLNANEKQALLTKLAQQSQRWGTSELGVYAATRLFKDPQVALFCFLYFCIELVNYAALFWLLSIIGELGSGLSHFEFAALNAVPWVFAILAINGSALAAARWRFQQAWVTFALLIAAVGLTATAMTTTSTIAACVSVCVLVIGIKSAESLFWPIPQRYLDPRIAAAALALINSVGNLGGFFGAASLGFLQQRVGSINGGVYALSVVSVVAGIAVLYARVVPKRGRPHDVEHE